jgi:GAF domain-containing protein
MAMAERQQARRKGRAVKGPAKPAVDLKREMAALKRELAQAHEQNVRLSEELQHRTRDLEESRDYQCATSDVLKGISRSIFDLQPVLDTLVETAARLCKAEMALVSRREGEVYRMAANYGFPAEFERFLRSHPIVPDRGTMVGRVALDRKVIHVVDVVADPEYRLPEAIALGGQRTALGVPLLREGQPIGVIVLARERVEPFTERQIDLVRTFADEAVIAMENARLLGELRTRNDDLAEALEFQTATGEVLRIVASSPDNLQPVFDAMLEKAIELCEAKFGNLVLYDGETFTVAAERNLPPAYAQAVRVGALRPGPNTALARLVQTKAPAHIPDMCDDIAYAERDPLRTATVELGGVRSMVAIPLLKKRELVGAFTIYRHEAGGFAENQIALVTNFADQAVIAFENARLLGELRQRTADLARSVDELTATGDVLKIISRSSVDLGTVLDTLVETVARLCRADQVGMFRRRDDTYHLVAAWGFSEEGKQFVLAHPVVPDRGTMTGRVTMERRAVHVPDVLQDTEYTYREGQKIGGYRTTLGIPLLREDSLIGIFSMFRTRVEPFTDKEIDLATTFADQAVIAIENARLFDELRERQAELARSVDELTATGDVLKIISRSSVDLETVLNTLVETVTRLCRADQATMFRRRDDKYHLVASRGFSAEGKKFVRTHPLAPDRSTLSGRVELERRAVHIPDVLQDPEYTYPAQKVVGFRTLLGIPLLRGDELIGIFGIHRTRVEPFTDKDIELATSFADQAVIAIENARLFDELRERQAELARSVDELTATSDVLKIISRSSVDLETVLDTLVETVARLCRADQAVMYRRHDNLNYLVASRGLSEEVKEYIRAHPLATDRGTTAGRAVLERRVVHVADVLQDPEYTYWEGQKIQGHRTNLGIPLLREDVLVGLFVVCRTRVDPFTNKEIELVQTFADQAVIAIENARLFDELRERTTDLARSVDELTATGDVLKIISRSSVDLETVLDTLVGTVTRLCRADFAAMFRRRGDLHHLVATCGLSEEAEKFFRTHPFPPGRGSLSGRVAMERRAAHIADVLEDPEFTLKEHQKITGLRTALGIPLLRGDDLIGIFVINRTRVEPFTQKEIELATSFADQAVIAIENARLFDELRERQADLARSVDELTATGDVLKIISRSSVDLETVLDTLVETVARLCRAEHTFMFRRRDDAYHMIASHGISEEAKEFIRARPAATDRGTLSGRVTSQRRAVHIPDALLDPEYTYQEGREFFGHRTLLGIPLLREQAVVGIFVAARTRVDPFTTKEIELATSFADQAVIAIENARLFDELRERQAELRVTFDNMGDGVAMFDGQQRLVAWNSNFQQILDMPDALLARRLTYADYLRILAERGEFGTEDIEAELSRRLQDTERDLRLERTRPDGRVIEVRRNPVPGGGFVLIYADITERKRAEVAINAARDAAERALRELQMAQASLVHAQKMAALGQLTAGIAHEIKNPLNFVNNFAGLSVELLAELKEASAQAIGALDASKRAEIVETIEMLTGNLEKIAEHGRRADGIVKSMLQHSRGGSGDWRATDLNALVEEALNLAYHGARAQDQSFNITLERDLDFNLAPIEAVPQEVTRVFLNLISNGFYAANKRIRECESTFQPVLTVTTRELGDAVEIRVRDNGVGIAAEHREKLFQPFFTTKPTGEGTGLGLSISYEIVTQQHGGTITVESEVDCFTEFTVRLPRRRQSSDGKTS